MANVVERIPQLADEKLAQLLQNSIRILAKPGDKRRLEALATRDAISAEFRRRAANHDWFPWQTTDAPGGSGSLGGSGWLKEGMLGYLDYHVGETNPTPKDERRLILKYAFEQDLPPLSDPEYYSAWGGPQTPQRLEKLANTMASLARNAKRRDAVALGRAIRDWEEDLEFLREEYYIGRFNFGWPMTG